MIEGWEARIGMRIGMESQKKRIPLREMYNNQQRVVAFFLKNGGARGIGFPNATLPVVGGNTDRVLLYEISLY